MSAAVKTIRRAFTVGKRRATLTVSLVAGAALGCEVEWDSDHPPRLSSADLARYRRLRNAVLTTVANELGAMVAVVDLEPDGTARTTLIGPEREVTP